MILVSARYDFNSFRANRLKLHYKNSEGKKELVHTLNDSALALPRIMAALLENNQQAMPEMLSCYLGFDVIGKI